MLDKEATLRGIRSAASRIPIAGRYSVRCLDEFDDGNPLYIVFFKPASIPKFVCTIKVNVRVGDEINVENLAASITTQIRKVVAKYAVGS